MLTTAPPQTDTKKRSLRPTGRGRCFLVSVVMWLAGAAGAQTLTLVELNCENLFDTRHDTGKQDTEYLPDGSRHWTARRYWRKLNNTAQTLLAATATADAVPDLVALCEVENDSVLTDLTRCSLLRGAGYNYLMTSSPDVRGIDVALLYSPLTFAPLLSYAIRVETPPGGRPTRDILYCAGRTQTGDTLHLFVVHAPSRYGGERHSRPLRRRVADRLGTAVDSVLADRPGARIVVAGDFNDGPDDYSPRRLQRRHRLLNLTRHARGTDGVGGTYRYRGRWQSIDHVLGSRAVAPLVDTAYVSSPPFLLEEEPLYGGYRPRRTFRGYTYRPAYSDHLPLVVRLRWPPAVR